MKRFVSAVAVVRFSDWVRAIPLRKVAREQVQAELHEKAEALGGALDTSSVNMEEISDDVLVIQARAVVHVPDPRPSLWELLWTPRPAIVLLAVGVACLATCTPARIATAPTPSESQVVVSAPEPADISVGDDDPEPEMALSKTVPPKPFAQQRKVGKDGKCPSQWHIAINGGCWRELRDTPTPAESCGEDAYEHEGRCYVWVRESKKANPSITE